MITEATSTGDALPAEDDDKGGKLRRRRQSQARSIGACLGLFCFLLLVLMVKMNHHDKYTPSKLRRHNRHSDPVAAAALEAKGVGEVVHYEELSILQQKFQSRGFSVLAFPISDFRQELDSNDKIREFVQKEYPQVHFPIFGLSTLQDNVVYQKLQSSGTDRKVKWNFFKYLVDRNGKVVGLYNHRQNPSSLVADIERLLDASAPDSHKLVTQ